MAVNVTYFETTETFSGDGSIEALPANAVNLELTRFVVQKILVPLVVTLGLIGNIMSIIVLTHRSMKSSTNTYLAALAIFDTLYLITSFILSFKHYKVINNTNVYQYLHMCARVMADFWSNVSVCLTVTFTVERYIVVCHPMKGRAICTPQRARIITLIVTLFALVSTSPEIFEFRIENTNMNNMTRARVQYTELANDPSYSVGFYWYIIIMFTFVPILAIWTFNWILIRSVCRASKLRKSMTYVTVKRPGERQGDQNRITILLISVAIVFLLCQLPNAALLIYITYLDWSGLELTREQLNEVTIGANVVNLLIQINAAINFLLYSVMSTKFRKVYIRLFYRRCQGERHSFNFSEYSYVTALTVTRRGSQFRPGMNKIQKDGTLISSLGNLHNLTPQQNGRRSWSPVRGTEHLHNSSLRCSSESLCSTNRNSVCNGETSDKLIINNTSYV